MVGSNKTKKNFKPVPIYALASGMYPIVPAYGQGKGNRFSINRRYSKDSRGTPHREPTMWFEGPSRTKRTPYIQGNTIFETRHSRPQWFINNPKLTGTQEEKFELGERGAKLGETPENYLSTMRSAMKGKPRSINEQLAKAMNVKLGSKHRGRKSPTSVPGSMAETYQTRAPGSLHPAHPYDTMMNNAGLNITAKSIGEIGHGQYGSGRVTLQGLIEKIDADLKKGDLKVKEAHKKKIDAAVSYFKERIPQWNIQIDHIKQSQGIGPASAQRLAAGQRLTTGQFRRFQRHFAGHQDISAIAMTGMMDLHTPEMWGTSGHFYSGSKQMTAQLLGNPALFFTAAGAWESFPIDDYTFAMIGPFRGYASGRKQFHVRTDIHGYPVRGYDASQVNQSVGRYGNTVYMSDIRSRMMGFLNASHGNTGKKVMINALTDSTHVELLTKAMRLRPHVNLVQASSAFNKKIDELIRDLQRDGKDVPKIVRAIMVKNRFKYQMKTKQETSVWAVPYISFFDVKSMGAGYTSPIGK